MTTLDDAIVEMVRARPMRVPEIASAAKLAALRLVDSGALVVGDDYVARVAAEVDMGGWGAMAEIVAAHVLTREQVRALLEEGRAARDERDRELSRRAPLPRSPRHGVAW